MQVHVLICQDIVVIKDDEGEMQIQCHQGQSESVAATLRKFITACGIRDVTSLEFNIKVLSLNVVSWAIK